MIARNCWQLLASLLTLRSENPVAGWAKEREAVIQQIFEVGRPIEHLLSGLGEVRLLAIK